MWDVGGLEVHGICNRRLVYSEVVEVQSNYKKSYLWWFENIALGDSTGSNLIQKYLLLFEGRVERDGAI